MRSDCANVYVVVASGVWPQSYRGAERGSFDSEAEACAWAEAEMQNHRETFTVEKRLVPVVAVLAG